MHEIKVALMALVFATFIYCVHLKSAFQTSQPERARCFAKEFSLLQRLSPPLWRLQVLRVCDIFICCYLSFFTFTEFDPKGSVTSSFVVIYRFIFTEFDPNDQVEVVGPVSTNDPE